MTSCPPTDALEWLAIALLVVIVTTFGAIAHLLDQRAALRRSQR
jgi:hypothetical protein